MTKTDPNSHVPIALPDRPPLPDGTSILAADVGGTKTHLAQFDVHNDRLVMVRETVYASKQFHAFSDVIQHFHLDHPLPERLCIAFAGPVQDRKAKATNLDWSIDADALATALGFKEVLLINDLEAGAYGLAALSGSDLVMIHEGQNPPEGNGAIIAPGTGLGEAGLYCNNGALHPFATEGGHTDFAPRTELDWELLRYLQSRFDHVSWERVVSGQGIDNIFQFLTDVKKREVPDWVINRLKNQEPAAAIGAAAKEGCPVCAETIELFVQYMGVEASNLALKMMATGGLFIGGGIIPKVWNDQLQTIFTEHFFHVGRLTPLLEKVPIYLVMNQNSVLLGAGYYGRWFG
jgi:glucokinase